MSAADAAIRRYLRHLRDPESTEEVVELRQRLLAADDPVERLLLRAQIDRARVSRPLEDAFVEAVRSWAQQEEVDAQVFLDEGVPRDVLVRAGLLGGRGGSATPRRPRVSADDVWAAIPDEEPFTLRDLQEATGASPATVRKVVLHEVDEGNIVEEGPVEGQSGRGRAPMRYRWVGEAVEE